MNGGSRTIEWDVIVFTQQWALTYCHVWRLANETNECNLEIVMPKNYWKVHGIWPTKVGTLGPNDCTAVTFDANIVNRLGKHYLERIWSHIDAKNSSTNLWADEWMKHGSCSLEIEDLNNEYKYLYQGMKWWEQFQLYKILNDSGIVPGNEYTLGNITDAVRKSIGKTVDTRCIYDKYTNTVFLNEILICFDKNLTLIHCDLMQKKKNFDCGKEWDPVVYPDVVPKLYYESGTSRTCVCLVTWICSLIVFSFINKFR